LHRHVLIALIAAVGCVSVAHGLGMSYWRDEAVTASVTTRSWPQLATLLPHAEGGFAGYEVFIHAWAAVFGRGETALRIPSLAAMFGTVVVTGLLADRMGRRWAGPVAAAAAALHPFLVPFFGLEARGYALCVFFVALAALGAHRAQKGDRGGVPTYAVASAVAVTLNFFAVLPCLVLLGWVVPPRPRRRTVGWLLLPAAVTQAMLVLTHRSSELQSWLTRPSLRTLVSVVGRTVSPGTAAATVILGVGGLVVLRRSRAAEVWALLPRATPRDVVVLVAWSAGPTLVLVIWSLVVTPSLESRYVLSSVLPIAVLVGLLADLLAGTAEAAQSGTTRRALLAVLAAGACALAVGSLLFGALRPAPKEEDLRAVSRYLVVHSHPGDGLLYAPSWAQEDLSWYLVDPLGTPPRDLGAVPVRPADDVDSLAAPVRTPAQIADALRSTDRVWLFGYPAYSRAAPDPGTPIAARIRECWQQLEEVRPGGGVELQLWQRPAGTSRHTLCPA